MSNLLSPHFKLEEVSENDMVIASLAWGFTLGFGWLTVWTAIKQTTAMYKRQGSRIYRNAYIWMIWLEIIVCTIFSVICWLYLRGVIPPSFQFYFSILTTWALQVQFLLQIIINRCAILLNNPKHSLRLKVGVAVLITAVNISVYNIWIPARLQISDRYVEINDWWDRCEKIIYLIVDGALNIYFVRIVQKNLVTHGLTKYKRLTRFNMFIIGFSLSMDVLIIAMMSLKNTFVYMQFHPLAYMVKLKIEMSMAELIGKVARKRDLSVLSAQNFDTSQGSYQPSESSLPSPSFSRGRHLCSIDVVLNSIYRNPIELTMPCTRAPKLRGANGAAVSSGPSDRRASVTTATMTEDGQPKMAIYRTREVVVEVETVRDEGHQATTSQTSQAGLNDPHETKKHEDDSYVKNLGAVQKSLALPEYHAPWAAQEFCPKIWDGTNYDEDLNLPTSAAKVGAQR
ncbi:uncharacterized protein LY79DRAFT_288068 [Colletotrichum navitas]|uniref:Integral membrane protein n=1 Tax=Colletotrichum navitas TaxID=681940 RepID=A0AAD8Q9J4_9PEZI|nr:uncharacterized protein LY79DRAFT_288068 [Colletotrichum navitas]KAK1598417.1 hypothetical protein LY79DRAFT_288068 [Colletotrichum navitas]